ncbi:hypothetical protein F4778DRAFT_316707 [Xylariomycetidae sp. FL2044]|nr:hypothetical protein F4778DRAFT_316707 [Xylariomycetidae sp. FL2044]
MSNSPSNGFATAPRHVRSRTQSISSDRPSTIGHSLMSAPLSVTPEAAFIAASAASQIVTNDHDTHSETWYDEAGVEPSGETALVSRSALQLANNFIDQLLFNIIAVAKSTTLAALRPAVSEVLKPKLAKDAINQADEELREYLGGGEMEDMVHSANTETPSDWDLELVWKRTRLRCMVYSSLGDMEEEDEDYYMEQEHLNGDSDDFSTGLVSPAVAIFLTSILEFMGEQVLVVAGQAAFNRLRLKYEKELRDGSRIPGELAERVVVEELDMERVALDRTLGRLWRSWKKKIRTPLEPNFSRPFSRSSTGASSFSLQRRESNTTDVPTILPPPKGARRQSEVLTEQAIEDVEQASTGTADRENLNPASLPLPDSDVEATYSDEEESDEEDDLPARPKSWIVFTTETESQVPVVPREYTTIRRARSLPSRKRPRFISLLVPHETSETPEIAVTEEQETPESEASIEKAVTDDQTKAPSGLMLKIATGAAAVGTAAVAGLASMATGNALTTEADDGSIEDFSEEPQILTSSRVSISESFTGPNSPALSESGRPASMLHARSNSVRSLRVIEVQSPRSPTVGSRPGSVEPRDVAPQDAVSYARSISREVSGATPPIVEEDFPEMPFDSASKRNAVVVTTPPDEGPHFMAMPTSAPRNRSPPKRIQAQGPTQPPAQTKVTILQAPAADQYEVRQDVPRRPSPNLRNPPMPTLPEKSGSRPTHGQSNSASRSSPESPKRATRPVQSAESPSSATSSKFKPVRNSEDSNLNRSGDMARNFEELIQSNETLQYTLTPENMRDIDVGMAQQNRGPKTSHRVQRSEDIRFPERSRSSSLQRSLSVTKTTGLGSHPPTDVSTNGKYAGMASNPPPLPSKARSGSGPQARDARVPRESMQDFAEFIRSTGPPGDYGPRSNRAHSDTRTIVHSITAPTTYPPKTSTDSRRTDMSNRARLQARDATVNSSSESSELIDFIRRGPPASNSNNPRIPRHVAPFRSTMDSDQMQMTGAVGGKAVDAVIPNVRTSQASTNATETSAPSSMNSQSALLSKASKMAQYSGNNFDDDDMMPKRTRRRVRDPYAIDFSDEEDELDPMPKPKPKQEESLIDFLNNYQPPPEPTPKPVVVPKKKSSAPNLIARLRASGSSSSHSNSHGSRKGSVSAEPRALAGSSSHSRGYTPIVVPAGAEKFTTSFGSSPAPRAPPTGRVPMKKFEPRDATSTATRTSDLASFLRDSEPPPSTMASLPSPVEDKSSSGFSRMFERRKKSAAY